MVFYARQDTRYLIYLYTRLKNELISRGNAESNLLHAALHQSNDICKKRYYKPSLHPDSHLDMVRKARATLNNKQLFCLKELFHWRDKLARSEDESVMYVLPNHMMLKIATELPREMQGIIACCNPVPPLVRQHLVTLHNIVLQARDKQLMAVDPALVPATTDNTQHHVTNFSTVNNLDLRHLEDSGDLETVIKKRVSFANNNLSKAKPDLSVFAKQKPKKSKPSSHEFVSPHQRYVLMRPYLESLEKVEDSKEEDNDKPTNDNIRLDSIRQHFEKLTEMTPKPVEKNESEEEETVESGEVTSEEDEVEPKAKKPYFEANNDERDKVRHLRAGVKEKSGKNKNGKNKNKGKRSFDGSNSNFDNSRRKSAPGGSQNAGGSGQERNYNNEQSKNKNFNNFNNKGKRPFEGAPQSGKKPRRKSESESNQQQKQEILNKETEGKKEQKDFDYNKVNFKNFGTKKTQDRDYDPDKAEKENSKKGGKKKNQFHKRGNKSATFKRS